MNRAVFLDRDGVINHAIVRNGKAFAPQRRDEFAFVNGAAEAISAFKTADFTVIVVTNQPDIARSKLSSEDLSWMTEKILSETEADDVVICPHDDHHACACRKPLPGMLVESAKKWSVNLTRSFMIGDSWKDMEAGKRAGCMCFLIDAPYNRDVWCDCRVKDLCSAAEIILKSSENS